MQALQRPKLGEGQRRGGRGLGLGVGLSLRGGKKKTFVTPTEANVHGDALCSPGHGTFSTSKVGG